jgi:hypothetical protein
MTKEMKDYSAAKNSNCHVTSDYESVDLLFGLTPKETYYAVGYFFDFPRTCGTAVMEMLAAAQKKQDEGEDNTSILEFSKGVCILTDIEKMRLPYDNYQRHSPCNEMEEEDLDEEAEKDTLVLHEHFISLVRKIDNLGFCGFTECTTGAVSEIQTKTAYEDMVVALGCAVNLYMACKSNLWENQTFTCSRKSKMR